MVFHYILYSHKFKLQCVRKPVSGATHLWSSRAASSL